MKSRAFWQRLTIVIALTACFALFQNASLDERIKEIQHMADQQKGQERPLKLLPDNFNGRTPQAVGEAVLKQAFHKQIEDVESQLEEWTTWESSKATTAAESNDSLTTQETQRSAKFKAGILNARKLGLSYEDGYRLRCSLNPSTRGIEASFDQPLNTHTRLSVQHKSEAQESSVGLTYNW